MKTNISQNIMIDPNEPLTLPDGTALTGRIEWFLYSLCLLDYTNLPTPLSRIEEFANALITGEVPDIEPQSRVEEYFLAIVTGNVENLPEPESRVEVLLNKLARGEFDLSDVEPIQSRYELLIAYLIKNSEIGDITYVLHEFLASETPYTMYNTQEKPTKSAILSGQTLVNLHETTFKPTVNNTFQSLSNHTVKLKVTQLSYNHLFYDFSNLKPNGKYAVVINVLENNLSRVDGDGVVFNSFAINYNVTNFENISFNNGEIGKKVFTFTMPNDIKSYSNSKFMGTPYNILADGGTISFNVAVFEVENFVNVDNLEYFEGMQSVKMPVLTTTGKNLFDIKDFAKKCGGTVNGNEYDSATSKTNSIYDIFIPKGSTISYRVTQLPQNGAISASAFAFIGESGKFYHRALNNLTRYVFEAPENYVGIKIINYCTSWKFSEFQIEKGSTATSYEPFKSNILTVNEDVELGSVGEVKDELNLLTGQLTQRTETRAYQEGDEANSEVITDMANTRYKLPKESIKTVGLSILDQDGATVEKLNTFKDITHVSCSVGEGSIYPYVEMEVATSNDEDLAAIGLKLEEKNKVQSKLIKVNDYQSDVIDNVMLGITEIYESI